MSTSLLYHALDIHDYGRTDHLASNGRRLAASTARGSVARVRLWSWFTPFRPCCDRNMGRKKGFTGRTRSLALIFLIRTTNLKVCLNPLIAKNC